MKLEITLKHGEAGKKDVALEITNDGLVLTEPDNQSEYPDDVVTLDRWQIRRLYQALCLWDEENQL